MRLVRFIVRLVLVIAAVLALAALGWWVTHRDEARAWRQAATIGTAWDGRDDLASTLLGVLGDDPQAAIVRTSGSLPTAVVLPSANADVPAVVLLVPDGTSARDDARIRDAQRAVARAGIAAWAVRIPSNRTLVLDPAARARVIDAIDAIAGDPRTRDRHVSVAAAGPAASLVLRATGEGAIAPRAVIAVQPLATVAGTRALLPRLDGVRAHLVEAALRKLVQEQSPLPVAADVGARVLVVDDARAPVAARDDARAVTRALEDARRIAVDTRDLAHVDTDPLFGVGRWWLIRAGG